MVCAYAAAVYRVLGIAKGTRPNVQLNIAFLISGTFHALASSALPAPRGLAPSEKYVGTLIFFWSQPAAIILESYVMDLCKHLGWRGQGGPLTRLLGYLWVATWFYMVLPFGADVFLKTGMGNTVLPVSPVRWLLSLGGVSVGAS